MSPHLTLQETQTRINKIKSTLSDLTTTLKTRDTLTIIGRKVPELGLYHPINTPWRNKAAAHKRVFLDLVQHMQQIGEFATEAHLQRWEWTAEQLRQWSLNWSEQIVERGLWDQERFSPMKGVFKEGWSFEEAYGKGPGLDDEVDPLDAGDGGCARRGKYERRG